MMSQSICLLLVMVVVLFPVAVNTAGTKNPTITQVPYVVFKSAIHRPEYEFVKKKTAKFVYEDDGSCGIWNEENYTAAIDQQYAQLPSFECVEDFEKWATEIFYNSFMFSNTRSDAYGDYKIGAIIKLENKTRVFQPELEVVHTCNQYKQLQTQILKLPCLYLYRQEFMRYEAKVAVIYLPQKDEMELTTELYPNIGQQKKHRLKNEDKKIVKSKNISQSDDNKQADGNGKIQN